MPVEHAGGFTMEPFDSLFRESNDTDQSKYVWEYEVCFDFEGVFFYLAELLITRDVFKCTV